MIKALLINLILGVSRMTDLNYTAISEIPQPVRMKGSKRPLLKTEFLHLAAPIHGNKFDYSLVPQDGIRKIDKVRIICRCCGEVFNQIVKLHVDRGCGCPSCSGRKPRTTVSFIEESRMVHGNKYDYFFVDYKRKDIGVDIVCNTCGDRFNQRPNEHIHSKSGCPRCSIMTRVAKRTQTLEVFISKAMDIHGNKYDYSNVEYVTALKKVLVTCYKHGDFEIRPNCLLSGKGCAKCARELSVGFSRSRFKRVCDDSGRTASLYIAKMTGNSEVFYKVGITSRGATQRLNRRKLGYNNDILFEIQGDADTIYDLEKKIHSLLSDYHYTPSKRFGGSAKECFLDIPESVSVILSELQQVS